MLKLCPLPPYLPQNGWTAIEMAEVKSADQETALRPELSLDYRHRYNGPRDYGKVIELLRGNLVEPVTPPSQHVRRMCAF